MWTVLKQYPLSTFTIGYRLRKISDTDRKLSRSSADIASGTRFETKNPGLVILQPLRSDDIWGTLQMGKISDHGLPFKKNSLLSHFRRSEALNT